MVNITNYVRSEFVDENILRDEGRECVIIDGGSIETREGKDGQEYTKLWVLVQFPSEYTSKLKLNRTSAAEISAELKTNDTSEWVGTRLKLTAKENGGMKWVEPTVIPPAPTQANNDKAKSIPMRKAKINPAAGTVEQVE